MMLAIHQMLEDGLVARGRRRHHRRADGATPRARASARRTWSGVDTLVHVADNCFASLTGDEDRKVFEVPAYIRTMVEKKLLGDKTKGGFYRKGKDGIETLDPKTLEYRAKGGDKDIKNATKELGKIEDPRERVRKLARGARARPVTSRGRCSRARSPTRRAASARSPTASSPSMTP